MSTFLLFMIGAQIIFTSEKYLWKCAYTFQGDVQSKSQQALLFLPAWGMSVLAFPFKLLRRFF